MTARKQWLVRREVLAVRRGGCDRFCSWALGMGCGHRLLQSGEGLAYFGRHPNRIEKPLSQMDQPTSLIALGVADLQQSRGFYERLKWGLNL